MKKGFTLIELLAVIVILAVIALIATPLVIDMIEESRINSQVVNDLTVEKAAITYATINKTVLPVSIGESTEIPVEDLVTNGVISPVASPFGNGTCEGYVLITKTEEDYDYDVHLDCFNGTKTSASDNLILNYDFLERAESTQNFMRDSLVSDAPGINITAQYWRLVDSAHAYGISEHGIETGGLYNSNSVYSVSTTSDWQNQWNIDWSLSNFSPDKTYTFSIWAKCYDLSVIPRMNFNFQGANSEGTRVDYSEMKYFTVENEWERFTITKT